MTGVSNRTGKRRLILCSWNSFYKPLDFIKPQMVQSMTFRWQAVIRYWKVSLRLFSQTTTCVFKLKIFISFRYQSWIEFEILTCFVLCIQTAKFAVSCWMKNNKSVFRLIKIKEWVDKNDPGSLIIPFSGAFEYKLITEYEDPVLRKKFLEDVGVTR